MGSCSFGLPQFWGSSCEGRIPKCPSFGVPQFLGCHSFWGVPVFGGASSGVLLGEGGSQTAPVSGRPRCRLLLSRRVGGGGVWGVPFSGCPFSGCPLLGCPLFGVQSWYMRSRQALTAAMYRSHSAWCLHPKKIGGSGGETPLCPPSPSHFGVREPGFGVRSPWFGVARRSLGGGVTGFGVPCEDLGVQGRILGARAGIWGSRPGFWD